jgi:hypothetical protein
LLNGQLILTAEAELVYQSGGIDFLLLILAGEPGNYTRYVPVRDSLPPPVLKLLRQITGAASGTSNTPPRVQVSTAFGVFSRSKRNGSCRPAHLPRTPLGTRNPVLYR